MTGRGTCGRARGEGIQEGKGYMRQGKRGGDAQGHSSCNLIFPNQQDATGTKSNLSIYFQYHWLLLATVGYDCLLLATIGYHWLPLATVSYRWLQLATNGYHWLPLATTGYHWLPLATVGYHQLPLATIGYHQLPLATIGYYCLPKANWLIGDQNMFVI